MLLDRPEARFLARSAALLIGLLALWWFLLLNPLLFLLRNSADIFGGIAFGEHSGKLVTEAPSGDWTFTVPWEAVIPDSPRQPGPARVHSIEFDLARSDAIAFTFSVPVYWAIALAASGTRRGFRPLVLGTVVVATLEIVLLLVFVEITAHNVAAQLFQSQGALAKWFLHFGDYLAVNVIPYTAPFLIAISLHPDLRAQILGWGNAEQLLADAPPSRGARVLDNRGRSKRQRRLGPARRA